MYIDETDIKRIFSSRNWAVANNYHKKGIIDTLDIQFHKADHLYNIYAKTDTFGYINDIELQLSEDGKIIQYACLCPYCDEKNACAHIGAVLLFLYDLQPTQFPYHYEMRKEQEKILKDWLRKQQLAKTELILDTYKRFNDGEFQANIMNEKVQIKAELCHLYQDLRVSFKIGINRFYVIKNIVTFLDAINRKDEVRYGKNLTFIHHINAFDETAQGTIQFLQAYVKSHASELSCGYYDKRNIVIDEITLDDFYDFYSEDGKDTINIEFAKDALTTIPLHIKKDKEDYLLTSSLPFDNIYKGENYWYQLEDECFYRYHHCVCTECGYLIQQLVSLRELLFSKEKMREFYYCIYERIKDHVTLEGEDLLEFMEENITCSCYIDLEENGDMSISAFGTKANGSRIVLFNGQDKLPFGVQKVDTLLRIYASEFDEQAHIAYITTDEQQTNFLNKGLPYLDTFCEVFISDAIKQLHTPKPVPFTIGVRLENNLLTIDVQSIQVPADELYAVLKSYRKKRKFHRLKNGDMIALQQETFHELTSMLDELHLQAKDLKNGTAQLPSYHSFALDHIMQDSEAIQIDRSETFKSTLTHIKNISKQSYPLPQGYESILRDYQVIGYQWIKTMCCYGFGGILADDMGLGKTLQMIAVLEDEKAQHPDSVSLIITPASLILNWQDEIAKFSSNLDCLCIHGNAAARALQMQDLHHDIIITSYDYLRRDVEAYEKHMFTYLILDEAQYIKNHTTKNASIVKRLQAKYRFALTGTPIENSLAELWSIFDFLMPGYLYNYSYFRKAYEQEIVKHDNIEVSKKLKRLVEPFILRRLKQDVLQELPNKVEQIQYLEFEEEEEKLYLANLVQINKELQNKLQMETFDKFQILSMMTRLRQLCCDARLLYENINKASSKIEGCMEIILNAKANHKKVLLFSSFTSLLDLLEEELCKYSLSYLKLTGATNKENRHAYVKTFQETSTDVFLISLKAGGTGLNLTAAEVVIHFDPWWNMSAQNQATDRAYRIGQTKNVHVYKLIMKNSIEEKIIKLQEKKKNLSNTFTSTNEGSIISMNTDEIMSLFQ